jgi:hypothetical protein
MSALSDVPIADMILETARRAALVHPGARVCILATLSQRLVASASMVTGLVVLLAVVGLSG